MIRFVIAYQVLWLVWSAAIFNEWPPAVGWSALLVASAFLFWTLRGLER